MAFWIALAVLVAGVVGGIVYAVVRGLALWRQVKRAGRVFSAESARIAGVSGEMEEHMDRASASGERFVASGARLAASRGRLEIQLQAVREAHHAMRRLLWFLPGV